MTKGQRFLVAITILNGAFAMVSISQAQRASAASDVAPVLRGRMLEVVDDRGRVRASIKVQEDSVVLRLINPDGRPGVKLAGSDHTAGLALIARQGDYLQVFSDGIKVTKEHRQRAAWP